MLRIRHPRVCGLLLLGCMACCSFLGIAQEKESESSKGSWTEDQREQLAEIFVATEESFLEGRRIRLVYDFETMNEELTDDWHPDPNKTKGRIRWSRGLEGTYSTVEHGIVIANHGVWLHEAVWDEVKVTVSYLSMQGSKGGDILAAVFNKKKGKRALGSNMGRQIVPLAGNRLAGKPHPREFPQIGAQSKYEFGYEWKGGRFTTYRGSTAVAKSSDASKKLVKGIKEGRAGLAWKGNVNGFVFKITLEGRLNSEWIEKQ